MVERLSIQDDSMLPSYCDHIQRYEFALQHCVGKTVLDAGCGVGYGSYFLAQNGAKSVTAVDLSAEALAEARESFSHPLVRHELNDVQTMSFDEQFDAIVNFENIEHIPHPDQLVQRAVETLGPGGVFITSTPDGARGDVNADGKPNNPFHVKEYTRDELDHILSAGFAQRTFYGQWLTPAGALRRQRNQELHTQLCEIYFAPAARLWRAARRALGRSVAPPPAFAGMDYMPGDTVIAPLASPPVPWGPQVLLAVCTN